MKRWFDATVGRRLVVRIWFHGVLLFAGVLATVLIARWMMSDLDQAMMIRHRPYLATGVAERVLSRHRDPAALATELARVAAETPMAVSVFGADDRLLASSATPARAPDVRDRARLPEGWSAGRLVVGAADGTVAIVELPPAPSIPMHVVMLLGAALVLAFLFVAAPLSHAIAKPIARLGALARALGNGDLAVRAATTRRDEIGDLGRTFDAMAEQLQHLRVAERQLLGDVSHELRTPLARMRVVLELAGDAPLENIHRYLGEIATDLGELEQLLDDIIVSTRLDLASEPWDEARPPLRKCAIASDELVDAAIGHFQARWPERAIAVRATGGSLALDGDLAMLRRVLDNFLDNARKYSPDDAPIAIEVDAVAERVRFAVIDRGVGIARDDHAHVFSAFFRADRSRTRSSGGVGLGLALARKIVEAHGGKIGFESSPATGSTFWFELARG